MATSRSTLQVPFFLFFFFFNSYKTLLCTVYHLFYFWQFLLSGTCSPWVCPGAPRSRSLTDTFPPLPKPAGGKVSCSGLSIIYRKAQPPRAAPAFPVPLNKIPFAQVECDTSVKPGVLWSGPALRYVLSTDPQLWELLGTRRLSPSVRPQPGERHVCSLKSFPPALKHL